MEKDIDNKTEIVLNTENKFKYLPFFNNKQPIFILVLVGFALYINSIKNEYALDDGITIHQNEFVLKGIKETKNIFTHDTYYSFYKRMNASDQLFGGRYRPLRDITYAVEQELIGTYPTGFYQSCIDLNGNGVLDDHKVNYTSSNGQAEKNFEYNEYIDRNKDGVAQGDECVNCWDLNKNGKDDIDEDLNNDGVFNEVDCQVNGASIRHFTNILIYILCCIALYTLLKNYIFKSKPDFAFVAAFLFLIHPIHTEAVAYVYGRYVLLSLLFMCCLLIFSLKYADNKSKVNAIASACFLLLGLLSSEYAVLAFIIVPVTLYVFASNKRTLALYLSLIFTFFIYLTMRLLSVNMTFGSVDTEVLNNPYLFANGQEKFATKIYLLLIHLKQSILPYPLLSDYSFETITLKSLTSWEFWLSFTINVGLLMYSIVLTLKKNVLGYGLLIYFIFVLFTSQLFFPTGLCYTERFLFHATIGTSIVLTILIFKFLEYLKTPENKYRIFIVTGLLILLGVCLPIVVNRNTDWKNDITLFLKDVEKNQRSVLILGNAGARWIDLADTKEITGKALPGQENKPFNDYNGTLNISDEDLSFFNAKTKREAALRKGINYLDTAVKLHPRYVNGYLNLGLAHFKLNEDEACIKNWKMAEHLYPNNPYLGTYYNVYSQILLDRAKAKLEQKKIKEAERCLKYALFINPSNEKALALKKEWESLVKIDGKE